MENSLAEVLTALQFAGIQPYLDDIALHEVLEVAAVAAPGGVVPPRVKRRRRSADELAHIRAHILHLVNAAATSVNTTQICDQLQSEGYELDTLRVSLMLKSLKREALVVDLGGRPKAWHAAGKRAAEPMQIKKKQAS